MKADGTRRGELAGFLRSRRERLRPAMVGFPTGPRRRSRGLRREEVAVLAGVSPTWYTYLEQGREIRPSPDVLDRLAQALCLTEDERRYVHTLALGHVVDPRPLDDDVSADEVVRQVVARHEDSPYPVYASDWRSDVSAWNPAAAEWYDDWGALPREERNLLRWTLTSPRAKARLVDWESEARYQVARMRAESARRLDDQEFRRRVAELERLGGSFAQWWRERDVREARPRVRGFRHPRLGERSLLLVPTRMAESSVTLVFHTPVPGA
ncbi:helix-turn-helix transcriptional regulator [Saccharothrix texasensis]|uniref:Helix-turn-helix protein n=1 Tax=Saccharothrix texasensis TaxID=103734 RepID=A0A3N1GYF4_9PSEU|nr:helix-turn-helix transcriptional regulator [Saccharothrix texasensis]ROP35199.1 helix-turn-helix protein [Saccharothrix texasensis]